MPKRVGVAPPSFTPWPVGLFSVAPPVSMEDAHVRQGIEWLPEPWTVGTTYADSCETPADPEDRVKSFDRMPGWSESDPFTVYAGEACSPVGHTLDERARRAEAAMVNAEQRAVERILWTGLTDNGQTIVPSFQQSADVTALGSFTVVGALAALEFALASTYGGVGIIHASTDTVTFLAAEANVAVVNGRLRTPQGTLVVSGGGYPGTGPDGEARPAGGAYMFGTGAVTIRRSEIDPLGSNTAERLDRATNTLVTVGERTYVVAVDGPILSAIADYEPAPAA